MKQSRHVKFRSLVRLAAAATACLTIADAARATVIVSESFGGLSTAGLNGTAADTFDGGIVAKGGSATWVANTVFKADGSVTGGTASVASTGTYGSLTLTQVVPVPEPGVLGLACGGFLMACGLVVMKRRSRVGGRA